MKKPLPLPQEKLLCQDSLTGTYRYVSSHEQFSVNKAAFVDFLKQQAADLNLTQSRICFHKDNDSLLQMMLVYHSIHHEVKRHVHLDKDEYLQIIDGHLTIRIYDKSGKLIDIVNLSSRADMEKYDFFCFLPRGTIHDVVIHDNSVFIETTTGPFRKTSTLNILPPNNDKATLMYQPNKWEFQATLPPLSASSQINPLFAISPKSFKFQFSIHGSSGALLLVPEDEKSLLEAVRNAKHTEPEEHLQVASSLILKALSASPFLDTQYAVRGLTDKDQSLVTIISQILHSSQGLILLPERHPLEAQDVVCRTPEKIICKTRSILIVRHLLEHARNLDSFLNGLRKILVNQSICLIEVPDSHGLFSHGDLTQLWEEHTVYFTSSSFHRALRSCGFDVLTHQKIISDGEELCLAVVSRSELRPALRSEKSDKALAIDFIVRLPNHLHHINATLCAYASKRATYIFGANHIAGLFLDLISSGAHYIRMVIDDDAEKIGNSLGLLRTPIGPLDSVDRNRPVHLLVAVNEGRAPGLYKRLRLSFPDSDGHRVESLVSLSTKCWEPI